MNKPNITLEQLEAQQRYIHQVLEHSKKTTECLEVLETNTELLIEQVKKNDSDTKQTPQR